MFIAMVQVSGVWEVTRFETEEKLMAWAVARPGSVDDYHIYEAKQIRVEVQATASIKR
jgi:hypothetical protein